MRSLLTTSIILIFLIAHSAMGVTVTPFSTTDQKRKVFSIVDNNYEDTRIDSDGDNSIDYWRIKKDNLLIETYFTKKRTIYHVRLFHASSVDERILFSQAGDLYLYKSQSRKQFIFNFTTQGPICVGNHRTEWEKLEESLKKISQPSLDKAVEAFIDSQCFDTLDKPAYEALADNIKSIFSIPSQKPNALLDCLQGDGVKKLFIEKFGDKEGPLNHEKAIIGFKNSIIKFSTLKQGDESILSCKKVEGENPKNPMKVTESGSKIQFQFGNKVDTSKIKEQLFHEAIHISSVADENINQSITNLCVNNKSSAVARIVLAKSHASAFSSTTTALDVLKGEQEVAKTESQKIPKSVAETPINPTKDKSPVDMNRVADAAGTATVAEVSKAQTSGVVRMAESVLASTPAVAAESSTSLASSSSTASESVSSSPGSASSSANYASSSAYSASSTSSGDPSRSARRVNESSRSPASEYQLDMSTVGGKTPTVKIAASTNGNGLGKGEYIKEEVDLTKSTGVTNSNVGRVPASVKTGSSDVSASSQTTNAEQTGSNGSYSSPGRGAPAASLGSDLQSSSSSNSNSSQRRRTSSQAAGGSYLPSRDEVVSFFSGGSYQQARGKLKDQGFVQTLKQNNITVYDLSGNTYGASKGEIIFVDQGDRFVRQK